MHHISGKHSMESIQENGMVALHSIAPIYNVHVLGIGYPLLLLSEYRNNCLVLPT